ITQYNIVPALLGVILQLTMVMMTAMALTRETERGTMENLLSMPATPFEIMLGKILPYLAVGAVQVVVVLVSARFVFAVPFVGGLHVVLAGIFIFVLALVILGYLISTIARTQMQAMQLTFFFFLPSLMLSGFMFPFRGMPQWAQYLGEIFPLTHFLRLIRAVMLKGAEVGTIAGPFLALTLFVLGFSLLALLRFRRTLD
ncbi:MAG: ABC transporter permease, partial [Rhodobacteraceae bacterium]|nr:ABC transporter permease [Paracoccaceae bacterium]